MKRHCLTVSIFLLLLGTILACGPKKLASSARRSEGERLFVISCQNCHLLPRPSSQSDEKWPMIVKRYGPKAKLTKPEIAAITTYLIANN